MREGYKRRERGERGRDRREGYIGERGERGRYRREGEIGERRVRER